jgi:hypothetical protein
MDNGVIATLEKVAAVLMGIATLVNTIDWFMTIAGTIMGHAGPSPASQCCIYEWIPIAGHTECTAQWSLYTSWQTIKANPILNGVVSLGTCQWFPLRGENNDITGCPIGDIAGNALGGAVGDWSTVGGQGSSADTTADPELNKEGYKPINDKGGIAQFHVSPFDNIYLATACLCPVAILHNLRKLKTIYQVHNCCVKEACENGQSTEACERQLDEATCMYWEGSLMKMALKIVASIAAVFMADMVYKWIKETLGANLVSCIMLAFDLTQIPSRIQAVLGSFSWLSETMQEPECSQLGFDDIQNQLGNSVIPGTQATGVSYTMVDTNNDGRADTMVPFGSPQGNEN